VLNTDAACYGGSDLGNAGAVIAERSPQHGHPQSLIVTLPPLATLVFMAEHP
jgi:1,4-alpha-glucan branching enzyme